MKTRIILIFIILPVVIIFWAFSNRKIITSEGLGWKLAYQSYTFKSFTFEEGLQKANKLGLKYVEAYRGQKLSSTNPNPTHYDADDATKKEMKHLLDKYQVKLINYGVVRGKDEKEWRRIFDFASEMGVETLTAEPEPAQFDFLERMCDEYEHNWDNNVPEIARSIEYFNKTVTTLE